MCQIKLFVIKYEGEIYKNSNQTNLIRNFERESGITPIILDQPTRDELLSFLETYSGISEKLIIHIVSHGFDLGICKDHPDGPNIGDKSSIISWDDLIIRLNHLSQYCIDLIVNLGNVCNSINILNCQIEMNFDALVTKKTVSDPVTPRKLNKQLVSDINSVASTEVYEILRKREILI